MIFSTKKYFLLAIFGALIIGIGTYLFLTSHFERVEILVASAQLEEGKKIEEKDLELKQYYKNSLPQGFITDKKEVIGKVIKVERKPGDPVTSEIFDESISQSFLDRISSGEVLLAVDMEYHEPLIDELKAGSIISIISTEKEKNQDIYAINKNYYISSNSEDSDINYYNNKSSTTEIYNKNSLNQNIDTEFIDTEFYKSLSENIVVIDGQIVVRNLEIIDIKKQAVQESNILIGSKKGSYYIFLKCSINEAPVISRITKENKYKIIMEKE